MNKIPLAIILVSVCVFIAVGPVFSAVGGVSIFEKNDANKDGKITSEESNARKLQWFKELDKDNDGKVTPQELSGSEFERIDVNKDGAIDRDEFVAFFAGPGYENKLPAHQVPSLYNKGLFRNEYIDKDNNGCIDRDECADYYSGHFEAFDTNKDGKIDPTEFESWRAAFYKEIDTSGRGYIVIEDFNMPVKADNK